ARVEVEGSSAGHGGVQDHGFGQVADVMARARGLAAGGVVPHKQYAALGGADKTQYELDKRAFAGAVVAGQGDAFAGLQLQMHAVQRAMGAVMPGGGGKFDLRGGHGDASGETAAGSGGGRIRGALSMRSEEHTSGL